MREITSPFSGGIIARRLIPVAVFIPLLLGLLLLISFWNGILSSELSTAVFALGIIFIFLGIIWYHAAVLNKRDLQSSLAKNALRESEKQIQNIFEAAPDAVILIDEEGKIVRWNSMAENLFGWKAPEVIGQLLSEIIIPHRYREAHRKGLKYFLETGRGPCAW